MSRKSSDFYILIESKKTVNKSYPEFLFATIKLNKKADGTHVPPAF
jgi:hypothetical protein